MNGTEIHLRVCNRNVGKCRRNTAAEQTEVNWWEQRARETVFRNGGRIISYTMSNTESWAWANPPTKRHKASSLKHILMPQDCVFFLPLKPDHSELFWGNILCLSARHAVSLLDLRLSAVTLLVICSWVPEKMWRCLCVSKELREISLLVSEEPHFLLPGTKYKIV